MLRAMRGLVPTVAVLGLTAVTMAADATVEDLKTQIDALQRKVESLEAKQLSSTDVDKIVRDVLKDAEGRSKLVPTTQGITGGYDKGKFILRNADGTFSFSPTAQLQMRYVGSYREDAAGPREEVYNDGFEIRRAKLGFAGNVVSPDLTYKFQWATSRNAAGSNASVSLEDAWLRYELNDQWAIFAGQFEDPITHEAITSSGRQLAVESSLVNSMLTEGISDYVQGVGAMYEPFKTLRIQGAFHDGAGSQNTNFVDAGGNYWGTTGRVDWMLIGDNWKQYDDFTALGNKSDLLVLGAGADYTQGANRDIILYGVDAQWEPQAINGFAAYAGVVGQTVSRDADANADDVNNVGYVLQAAYAFNKHWEVFARFDEILFDAQAEGVQDQVQEITLGVNYYINGHSLKLTADVGYLPNGFDGGIRDVNGNAYNTTNAGVLPTEGNSDQFIARVQLQLLL